MKDTLEDDEIFVSGPPLVEDYYGSSAEQVRFDREEIQCQQESYTNTFRAWVRIKNIQLLLRMVNVAVNFFVVNSSMFSIWIKS